MPLVPTNMDCTRVFQWRAYRVVVAVSTTKGTLSLYTIQDGTRTAWVTSVHGWPESSIRLGTCGSYYCCRGHESPEMAADHGAALLRDYLVFAARNTAPNTWAYELLAQQEEE